MMQLSPKQYAILPLIKAKVFVSCVDIAHALNLTPRTVREFCKKWVAEGFLEVADPSNRARMYKLGAKVGA